MAAAATITRYYRHTPLGDLEISASDTALYAISFVGAEKCPAPNLAESAESNAIIDATIQQLQEYFEGKRQVFDLVLAPQGTDFQKRVWDTLLGVSFGKTCSYLEIARRLGDEKCIRAAASANGKNPLPIVIPCHRIIGSDGSLTGYAGDMWRKSWLLKHENPTQLVLSF